MTDRPIDSGSQTDALLDRRSRVLGGAYRLFYDSPVQFVRGEGVWLFDPDGRAYLDAYNNVPCVGHCHPRVVAAMNEQSAVLNTHTRYLTEQVVEYAERLVGCFPAALDRVVLTCTGSEANDLACRLARCATGGSGFIVSANAYHGVTSALAGLSPSLGTPLDPVVRTVSIPRDGGAGDAELLAERVRAAIADLREHGIAPAALLVDTIFASDGIVPAALLAPAAAEVRRAGGLVIADEVQAGFARLGPALWGFERHGLVPDIVTLGKPMGNGYPLAGVVTGSAVADEFGAHTRYFNTFGGNPVACAAGLAVLDVIESDDLRRHVASVGEQLSTGLADLARKHPSVGQVRGAGLYLGVDIVVDGAADAVAGAHGGAGERAQRVVNGLRDRRVLVGTCGPDGSTLKIRPPLVFEPAHVDRLVAALDDTLTQIER